MTGAGAGDRDDGAGDEGEVLELLYGLPIGLCLFRADGTVDFANPLVAQVAMPIVGPVGMSRIWPFLDAVAPGTSSRILEAPGDVVRVVQAERVVVEPSVSRRRDGRDLVFSLSVQRQSGGRWLLTMADVTAEHEREVTHRKAVASLEAIVNAIVEYALFTVTPTGMVDSWNRSGERLLGRTAEAAIGRSIAEVLDPSLFSDGIAAVLDRAVRQGWVEIEGEVFRTDGRGFWSDVILSPILTDVAATGFTVVVRDLTERKTSERALQRAAFTDALTGLWNRRHLFAHVQRLLADAEPGAPVGTIAALDLDRFKSVNDTHGHDAGDAVLVEVGRRLTGSVRRTDVVCRFGGEEFVVFLQGADLAAGRRIAETIRRTVAGAAVTLPDGQPLPVTASIGVAVLRADGTEALTGALQRADAALYEAKDAGRNRVTVADPP